MTQKFLRGNPNGKKPRNASLILSMKRIHSIFMCTNTKEAPTA